jgi:aconitase B
LIKLGNYFFQSFSGRKGLEQRTYQDDERIATLEQQLAEAQLIAEDSDRKYDEVIRLDF